MPLKLDSGPVVTETSLATKEIVALLKANVTRELLPLRQ